MNQKLLIYAPSGKGKTASMRNLDPAHTGILNTDRKALPFKDWKKNYVTVRDSEGKLDKTKTNYFETSTAGNVLSLMKAWEANPEITLVALDTLTHLINAVYMATAIGKDYSGFQKMGVNIYDVLNYARSMTTDVVIFAHEKISDDEISGRSSTIKSQGKMIEGFEPPSFFTTVLYCETLFDGDLSDENARPRYVFRTVPEKGDIVKVPTEFDGNVAKPIFDRYIDNDLVMVIQKLADFEGSKS